jgi:hypothetical protein
MFGLRNLFDRPVTADRVPSRPRARRASRPAMESLEQRRVLSTAWATSGSYRVEAWTEAATSSDTDVYARVLKDNQVVVSRIAVARTGRDETEPVVSINSNGVFSVAYTERINSSDTDIMARVFRTTRNSVGFGVLSSNAIRVNNSTKAEFDPSISISPDGLTVAVGYTQRFASNDLDVMTTRLNVQLIQPGLTLWEGNPAMTVNRTFRVGDSTRNETDSSVIVTNNGNFVVSYSFASSTGDLDVRARAVRSNQLQSVQTVAATLAGESSSHIDSVSGNTITVTWLVNGSRRSRTMTV